MDSGKRLIIIEVKLSEDKNVLFQALGYYSVIDRDRYVISASFEEEDIDPKQHPRIILIAERFSDDLRRLSTLVKPDIELFEYTVLENTNMEKGIVYRSVSLPAITEAELTPPQTIEGHKSYLTDESPKPVFEKAREEIKSIAPDIEEYVTQNYIGYKFKGRQLAFIGVKRKAIDIGCVEVDESGALVGYPFTRVETPEQNYPETLELIRQSYLILSENY